MKFAILVAFLCVITVAHRHSDSEESCSCEEEDDLDLILDESRSDSDSCESSSTSSSSEESRERHRHRHHHEHHQPHYPPCQEGWTTFDRPQGRWCVKVFPAQGAYAAGESFCGGYGAKLTGIQNGTERQILADLALAQNPGGRWTVASTWIGSMRSVGSTFVWTDGHTTGVDGFKWGATQPDAQRSGGVVQNCVQQFIITPAYWRHPRWRQVFHHGDLDDWYCHISSQAAPNIRFFACGKKP